MIKLCLLNVPIDYIRVDKRVMDQTSLCRQTDSCTNIHYIAFVKVTVSRLLKIMVSDKYVTLIKSEVILSEVL